MITASRVPPPFVCRRPLDPIRGSTPVMDEFLVAVLLGHGVRLVNTRNTSYGFDIYDYRRYYDFSQSLSGQEAHHKHVTPGTRMKAILQWMEGDTADMIKCVQRGAAHACCRLTPRKTHIQKIADHYTAMHVFIKAYL